jgi:predicted ATP-binding protein involved in virulence
MNIQSIKIQNFRNVGEERTFFLNSHFTVFIGINGKGKSTILHALRVLSGSYFLGIPNSEVKSRHIHRDEIRCIESNFQLVPQFPVLVEATGTFPGMETPITWRRQWLEGKSSVTTMASDVGNIKEIATSNYTEITKKGNDQVSLPLIAFFGISRAVGAGRVTPQSRIQKIGRIVFREGYQDWDEMRAIKFHYREWLGRYDMLLKQLKEYAGTKDAFFDAIRKANPYISQVEFSGGELWAKAKIDDQETNLIPIGLHSDGIHYFTEMVAELAYRCVVLNGFKEGKAIEEATGIVMVDELDLHLHPKWQRHVVGDLKAAFPNIQFVVTTHSPFIVQSLKSEELIILDEQIKKDGDPDMKGIEDVAANEMGVEDVPRSEAFLEMQKVAEQYYTLIRQGKTSNAHKETAKLRNKLNELEQRFSNDPAFVASLQIERKSNGL